MTLVTARTYRDGVRVHDWASLSDVTAPVGDDELLWIGLHEPDASELDGVAAKLGLHPLAVEDAVKAHQLPKVEIFPDHLFVIAYTAHLCDEAICYGETAIFVGRNFIVTSRHGSQRNHANVRSQLEAGPALLALGSDYVLHAILDHIADGYFPVIEAIEERVLAAEDKSLDAFLGHDDIARLFRLRRELVRFQRKIDPMEDVAARLANHELPFVDGVARPYFRDVFDHVRRSLHRATDLREVLIGVIETSGLLEQQRQGTTTRQLAAWAAILAVPTAIAGIYGMNFEFMPETEWVAGYPMALALMASACGFLYFKFKRSGWL